MSQQCSPHIFNQRHPMHRSEDNKILKLTNLIMQDLRLRDLYFHLFRPHQSLKTLKHVTRALEIETYKAPRLHLAACDQSYHT